MQGTLGALYLQRGWKLQPGQGRLTTAVSRDALELLGVFEPVATACFSATSLSHSLPLLHGLSLRLSLMEHFDAGHGWNPPPLQSDNVFPPMLTLFSSPSPHTALLTALLHILSILTY